jgi:dipeptidyl aminopeptidase/acylaminoacyl peptidase
MRIAIFFFIAAGLASAQSAADSPETRRQTDPRAIVSVGNPQARPIPIDDLFFTRSVFGPAWSPDGKQIVLTTNLTGRFNLWKVPAAGGWPLQIAQSDDRQVAAAWSPDGKWIVWQEDRGGGEVYDLLAIPSDGGEVVNLTNSPTVSETDVVWSPAGGQFALSYKPRTSSVVDIALMDWQSHKIRNLTNESTKDHLWGGVVWGADGKTLFATRGNSGDTDSSVYRIDVASAKAEELTPHKGDVVISASSVTPDGRTILITSNEKGGHRNVALLDAASGKLTWATATGWEASAGDFSPDGKSFTYTINEDGRTDAYLADTATLHAVKLAFPPGLTSIAGTPGAFSPSGASLLVEHQSSRRPADLWVYDIASNHASQLTFSGAVGLNPETIPASQLIRYRSFDGKMISAFLWMPFNLKRDGSSPAIVIPHGGPTGQTVDSFNRTAGVLASRGYVCIAPNVRGSTGYGMAFQKANYQDLGGGDLQDEVFAAKFLVASGYVDEKKIGITGGSYGGYMTLMAVGKTPEVWAAGVEMFGITDWYSMLEHEDPLLQEYEKTLLGDPVKDKKVYQDASPIQYLKNTKAPLLVLQGDNDIRVPKEEAQQVVSILDTAGKTVAAHYYPHEGHGFAKRENQIDAMKRTLEWFDRYLKGVK